MADQGQGHGAETLAQDFLGHLWPPFTQMQGLKPVIMDHAEGAVVYDSDGKAYIDAFASLWTVNVGHGRQEIYDAIRARDMAYTPRYLRHIDFPSASRWDIQAALPQYPYKAEMWKDPK